MKRILPLLIVGLFATGLHAETADDIIKKFEAQKAEALEAYLKANEAASDKAAAQKSLISSYTLLGENDKVTGLLMARYAGMPKGKDGIPREVALEVARPLMDTYVANKDKAAAKALFERIKKDFAEHPEVSQLAGFLDNMLKPFSQPMVGDVMEIEFTSFETETKINLADYKGKVVLIDFWATWCGPCVSELPNVKKAYADYHDKGFDIIAISLDKDKAALASFIKKQELPWPQMFDGQGWNTKYAKQYGISGIPATYLIGPDGKISHTNLRGAALGKAVGELLADAN